MTKKLTTQICEEWKKSDRSKNPLTGKTLRKNLKKILSNRCNELLQESSKSPSFSYQSLMKVADKIYFKNSKSSPRSSSKSSSYSSSKSSSLPSSKSSSSKWSSSQSSSRSPPKSPPRSPPKSPAQSSKSSSKSSIRTPKSLSLPNSIEIEDIRENLPYLFELSFHDFEKMQSDNHRIDTVLLNYDITDPYEVKLVKKFIKYIINIPNAKSKKNKELSEIIKSRKYKKTSFKDLPDDIVRRIGQKYYDIMTKDQLLKWIDKNKIDWEFLSMNINPAATKLLEQNLDKINWFILSLNENPAAIKIFEQNPDKINWKNLSQNPAAIRLLKQNQDKIDWKNLSSNPAIFH